MNEQRKTPDRPTIEKALRAAGLSSRQAKKLLSGGWRLIVGEEAEAEAELLDRLEAMKTQLFDRK
jgi:hypothetical protein